MTDAPATPVPPGEPTRDWHPAGWAAVAVAFLVGFANFPMQVVGWRLDQLPGEGIDNRLNNFILEHGYRCLTGRAEGFWDAPSYYPRTRATSWSDAHIGMLPVYAGVRALGASPERAFQWHFLLSCALNFAAAAWAARRLGFGPVGAAAAAYVFAYALPVVGQTQHTQLIPRFLVPPAVVFAWEFLWMPRTWRFAACAACVVYQFYVSVYIGFFLGLMLAAGLLVAVVRCGCGLPWQELLRPGWRVWAARVAVAAVAFLAAKYLADAHKHGSRGGTAVDGVKANAPFPVSWLTAPRNAYLHWDSPWSPIPDLHTPDGEHLMLPGLVPLAAVAVGALLVVLRTGVRTPRQVAVVSAWVCLLLAVLVTQIGDVWLYKSLAEIRGVGGIRVPGRVCLVLLFPAGLAVAYLLDGLVNAAGRPGRGPAVAAAVLGLALVAADQRLLPREGRAEYAGPWRQFHFPLEVALDEQARMAEVFRSRPGVKIVYVFPTGLTESDGLRGLQVIAMRAAQELGLECVNGWTGHAPLEWRYFPDYRSLMAWFVDANQMTDDELAGLLVVGDPLPDVNPMYEALMRAAHPPAPRPKWR